MAFFNTLFSPGPCGMRGQVAYFSIL
jgi:hypothetical protein